MMTRKKRHRHERLKSFPKQTMQLTTERLGLIKNIKENLSSFGFRTPGFQLFTIELDNCSLKYFAEALNYLVKNNCKNLNNVRILNESKTLEIDHGILQDLNETNLLNQANFDLFFSLEDRYPIAAMVRFLKKQRLLTQDYFDKVFHHKHFDDLQSVIGYLDMFLGHNELLPDEIFDKALLVKDLKHLSDMFDNAVRSDDFSNKHNLGLKLIKQLVNYSAHLTEEIQKSCQDILSSNSFENCATSSKDSCKKWFKSVSSTLDECVNNIQLNPVRRKRSLDATLNTIIPNINSIAQTTSNLIGNSTNNISSNVSSSYLANMWGSTFLLFTSLVSWLTGKKIYFHQAVKNIDINQTDPLDQIEKQVLYAIDKYENKKEKEKFVKTNKLQFFKGSIASNDTNKLENTNSSLYSIR